MNNEAVLEALFKHKEDDLTFAKAVAVAMETEEAAKVAKEKVHGVVSNPIHLVEASRGLHFHQVQDHSTRLFTELVHWDLCTLWRNGPQVGCLSFQGCYLSILPEVRAFGGIVLKETGKDLSGVAHFKASDPDREGH